MALVWVLYAGLSCTPDTADSLQAKTGIRGTTECVSNSCAGPLHRYDQKPTTLRTAPEIAANLPHAANFKNSHWNMAGVSRTRRIKSPGRSITSRPQLRHPESAAAMPAFGLPSVSYAESRTTPSDLSDISFGADANPHAPQAFILLFKNGASTDEAVAAHAYTSRISSPIFDPGQGTTLDFRPGSDPDPPDPTFGKGRTTLTAPADETDTLTAPSRVRTTISGAPPGRPNRPIAAGRQDSIFVSWTAPSNSGPAITGYDVQYRITGTEEFTVVSYAVTVTRATITGLSRGKGMKFT